MVFDSFFEVKRRGIFKEVSLPVFGSQDVGISPGGAMDRFAFECGNALLGNPSDSPALEMLVPPVLTARKQVLFALVGASLPKAKLEAKAGAISIQAGTVYSAERGASLLFGSTKSGLRSYLCFREAGRTALKAHIVGRSIEGMNGLMEWVDRHGLIRVIDGPEMGLLDDRAAFFSTAWTVSAETDDMGMRLTSAETLQAKTASMISEAVSTGTIQLTPEGPIVLLKHRQTLGGYPRIFSVISADVDLLAQCLPGQTLNFRGVTVEEAWRVARQKAEILAALRSGFH